MARSQTRDSLANLNQEITIAGGGLAGLSLATALRLHDVPVTVLEAGNYPRHRVCGEFISGVSEDTLEALGIADLFADAHRHRSLSWHDGGRLIHQDSLKTPALGISRFLLDQRLRERVESLGGSIQTRIRAQPVPHDGYVWAAGRRPQPGRWIGLKAHVRGITTDADLEMHAGRNGYVGLAGVEDGWLNVCGLFQLDKSIHAPAGELLTAYIRAGGNSQLADALRAAEWRDGSCSAVAGFELGRQPGVPGLLCLGDSESMIPPFTGNGMSMAFQAAEAAVGPLVAWSRGECAWQKTANTVRTLLRRKFRRRLAVAGLLHPTLLAGKSGPLLQDLSAMRLLPFQPILALLR